MKSLFSLTISAMVGVALLSVHVSTVLITGEGRPFVALACLAVGAVAACGVMWNALMAAREAGEDWGAKAMRDGGSEDEPHRYWRLAARAESGLE